MNTQLQDKGSGVEIGRQIVSCLAEIASLMGMAFLNNKYPTCLFYLAPITPE